MRRPGVTNYSRQHNRWIFAWLASRTRPCRQDGCPSQNCSLGTLSKYDPAGRGPAHLSARHSRNCRGSQVRTVGVNVRKAAVAVNHVAPSLPSTNCCGYAERGAGDKRRRIERKGNAGYNTVKDEVRRIFVRGEELIRQEICRKVARTVRKCTGCRRLIPCGDLNVVKTYGRSPKSCRYTTRRLRQRRTKNLCKLLGVSKSGYYAWAKRRASDCTYGRVPSGCFVTGGVEPPPQADMNVQRIRLRVAFVRSCPPHGVMASTLW